MAFVKGQSGNPGGKPKELRSVVSQARRLTPLALRELRAILNDPEEGKQAKISAASVILDRAWGRPSQAFTGADGSGDVVDPATDGSGYAVAPAIALKRCAVEGRSSSIASLGSLHKRKAPTVRARACPARGHRSCLS